MKNYPDQLALLHQDRMEGLTNDIYPKEYLEELNKIISVGKEIEDALPKDKAHLMKDLDSAHGSLTSIY